MKRKIKFRAWHKKEKKLCHITLLNEQGAFLKGIKCEKDTVCGKLIVYAPKDGRFCKNKEFVLTQYIGLNDSCGKEIYEGDIIEVNMGRTTGSTNSMGQYNPPEDIKYLRVVIWLDEYARFDWEGRKSGSQLCEGNSKYFEVIGNIYQNVELLNKLLHDK